MQKSSFDFVNNLKSKYSKNEKHEKVKSSESNQNEYSLILSLKDYRKSITKMAIGCIKKQNISFTLNKQNNVPLAQVSSNKIRQKSQSFKNMAGIDKVSINVKSKNRKYNYGVCLEDEENELKNQYQIDSVNNYDKMSSDNCRKFNDALNKSKSQSFKSKIQKQYITKPFKLTQTTEKYNQAIKYHKNQQFAERKMNQFQNADSIEIISITQPSSLQKKSNTKFISIQKNKRFKNSLNNSSTKKKIFLNQSFNNQEEIKSSKNSSKFLKQLSKQKSFKDINLNKSKYIVQKQKSTITDKEQGKQKQAYQYHKKFQKQEKQIKIRKFEKCPQSKPIYSNKYPKTETYTSRSEYNLDRLTNKLDSYINKHINHEQKNSYSKSKGNNNLNKKVNF